VYGSGLSGNSGCDDISELVEPSPKQDSIPEISQAVDLLASIKHSGVGGLQNAIMYAISRLVNRRGTQQVFVITSRVDDKCDPLDRSIVDAVASRNNIELELVIVSIGALSKSEMQTLETYADRYVHVGTSDELSSVIDDVLTVPPSVYRLYPSIKSDSQ
jgi:hypothetical protein